MNLFDSPWYGPWIVSHICMNILYYSISPGFWIQMALIVPVLSGSRSWKVCDATFVLRKKWLLYIDEILFFDDNTVQAKQCVFLTLLHREQQLKGATGKNLALMKELLSRLKSISKAKMNFSTDKVLKS